MLGDNDVEPDETLQLNLSSSSLGVTVGTPVMTGTILDDDQAHLVAAYFVTVGAGPNGRISPSSGNQKAGYSQIFTLTPNPGYGVDTVTGCSALLVGNTYTIPPLQAECTIAATLRRFQLGRPEACRRFQR